MVPLAKKKAPPLTLERIRKAPAAQSVFVPVYRQSSAIRKRVGTLDELAATAVSY
jgi:hypothetical protein